MKAVFIGAGCVATWLAGLLPAEWDRVAIDPKPVSSKFPMPVLSLDILDGSSELEQVVTTADIVFLAVPVDVAMGFLERWNTHLRPDCIVIDTLSTKSSFADRCAKLVPHLSAAGINPLFRPQPESDGGYVIGAIYKADPRITEVIGYVTAKGFEFEQVSVDQHDQVMGAVQGLTHAAALGFGQALAAMVPPSEKMMTPPYRCMAAVFARLVSGAAHVPWEIQRHNPYANAARRHLIDALEELDAQILNDDKSGFTHDIEGLRQDTRLNIEDASATAARLFSVANTSKLVSQ